MPPTRASSILTFFIVLFCLAGIVDSSLVLREHYNNETSPCDINDVWDCGIVNHSPYAVFHKVPVAMIGIVGYALLAVLAGRLPWLTAILAFGALLFSLRLTWIEWKALRVWCLYCVTSQGIILLVFVLTVIAVWVQRRD